MSGHSEAPFGAPGPHNWLIFTILNAETGAIGPLVQDRLVIDIGCGGQPARPFIESRGGRYVGLDHPQAGERGAMPDVIGVGDHLPFASGSAGAVLLTTVLEHLPEPFSAMTEIARILKAGGNLVLTAPQYWHLHEEPRDYFRFTRFGLAQLAEQAGLEVLEIKPLGNFWTTFMQELAYWIQDRPRGRFAIPGLRRLILESVQWAGLRLSSLRDDGRYSWLHLMTARKPHRPDGSPGER